MSHVSEPTSSSKRLCTAVEWSMLHWVDMLLSLSAAHQHSSDERGSQNKAKRRNEFWGFPFLRGVFRWARSRDRPLSARWIHHKAPDPNAYHAAYRQRLVAY